ncbi:MAG: DUF4232 domain-containing protein [Pseudonocardiaceae bacterium]
MSVQPQARCGSLINMRRRTGVLSLSGTLFAALAVTTTACSTHQSPHVANGTTHPPSAPTSFATTQGVSTRVVPRCRAADVRMSVAKTAAVMSQPFSDISITNTRKHACVLIGYPGIAVAGHRGFPDQPAPAVPVGITVRHRIYERVDPGPHPVLVRPSIG